jgi:hypothetical protein
MVDHDRMEESVAAYVLDASDEAEREAVRTHIEGCPACRDLVARLTQVVDVLPLGSDVVRPPERLRDGILAAAAASPPGQTEPEAPPAARRPRPPRSEGDGQPVATGAGWRRFRLPALTGAAAALAALGAMTVWNVSLQLQLNRPPEHYSMSGTGTAAGASAEVMAYRPQGPLVVVCAGLPPPAPGRVYELWVVDSAGRYRGANTFEPDPDGRATVVATRPVADARELVVTEEQAPRGADAPTEKPLLRGRVG